MHISDSKTHRRRAIPPGERTGRRFLNCMFMSSQICTHLQARPDLSLFRFTAGLCGSVIIELRFTALRPGVFDFSVQEYRTITDPTLWLFNDEDVDELLLSVVQAIELYTGKHPERIIRLKANNRLESAVFQLIAHTHFDKLRPMFTIEEEVKGRFIPFRRNGTNNCILLKRKPDPDGRAYPIQLTLNTHSGISGKHVQVRLCEELEAVS